MPWFKVDDKLHDHRKARAAGAEAMGLWVLAGSWSADQGQDGFVPESVCPRWSRAWRRLAQRLVDAGFWNPVEKDGEAGWQFHNWSRMQPTAAEVKARREDVSTARSKAGKKGAAARWGNGKSDGKPIANDWQADDPDPSSRTPFGGVLEGQVANPEALAEPPPPPSEPRGPRGAHLRAQIESRHLNAVPDEAAS